MRHTTPAQTPEHETERSLRSTLPAVGLLLLLGALGLGSNPPAASQAPKPPAQPPVVPPGLTPAPQPGPPPALQAAKQCKKDSDCPGAQVCRSSTCVLPAATPASTPAPQPPSKPKPYTVAEVKWSALP